MDTETRIQNIFDSIQDLIGSRASLRRTLHKHRNELRPLAQHGISLVVALLRDNDGYISSTEKNVLLFQLATLCNYASRPRKAKHFLLHILSIEKSNPHHSRST